mmetsp:Transcript_18765/g.44861  ORF Transcript_18765/g.44861 Transcript_18765/m.44861 type:complete len:234 (-) Transcript_18765:1004-1705(-)
MAEGACRGSVCSRRPLAEGCPPARPLGHGEVGERRRCGGRVRSGVAHCHGCISLWRVPGRVGAPLAGCIPKGKGIGRAGPDSRRAARRDRRVGPETRAGAAARGPCCCPAADSDGWRGRRLPQRSRRARRNRACFGGRDDEPAQCDRSRHAEARPARPRGLHPGAVEGAAGGHPPPAQRPAAARRRRRPVSPGGHLPRLHGRRPRGSLSRGRAQCSLSRTHRWPTPSGWRIGL